MLISSSLPSFSFILSLSSNLPWLRRIHHSPRLLVPSRDSLHSTLFFDLLIALDQTTAITTERHTAVGAAVAVDPVGPARLAAVDGLQDPLKAEEGEAAPAAALWGERGKLARLRR